MKRAAALLVGFACSGAFASQPGQPFDCGDWVYSEPGHSCTAWVPYPADIDPYNYLDEIAAFDMAQRLIRTRIVMVPEPQGCLYGGDLPQLEILWIHGTDEGVVATMPPRCNGDSWAWAEDPSNVEFDPTNGMLLVRVYNRVGCWNDGQPCPTQQSGSWVAAIHGFTTTFEVLQNYARAQPNVGVGTGAPQDAQFGFRVPARPEGMAGAEHFDTYWGNLTHPIDFTQSHPLQCNYPSAAPHAGDYLTVADTIPTPAPGQGVYYVTAAIYQGATRYGRKTTGGHLSGRDPAVLPVCSLPVQK